MLAKDGFTNLAPATSSDPPSSALSDALLDCLRRIPGQHCGGSGNEIAVAVGHAPVGQNGRILQTGPASVSASSGSTMARTQRAAMSAVSKRWRIIAVAAYWISRR
jgi:hypothetical protein